MRKPFMPGLSRSPSGDTLPAGTYFAHGSAEEVAADWANRLGQSTSKIQAGVNRVQQAPGQAAVAARQKWVNALSDPKIQDKWARQVGAVSLASWQESMNNKGVQRVAQGAQAAQQKYANAVAPLLRYIDSGLSTIKGMDSSTYAAREQRMIAWSRYMAGYQKPAGT